MGKMICWILMLCMALACVCGLAEGTVTPSEPDKDAQGWIESGDGKIYGDLDELIAQIAKGKIYIQTEKAVRLKDVDARSLIDIRFLPDPEAFTGAKFTVRATLEDPGKVEDLSALEDIDFSQYKDMEEEQIITLYVWVMRIEEQQPQPTVPPVVTPSEPTAAPDETSKPEPTDRPVAIKVQSQGAVKGEWTNEAPVFTLSGIPENVQGLRYAAIVYDREIIELDGDRYIADIEGVTQLRFAIVDEMGDIVSSSERVTVYVDLTAPENVSAAGSMQKSYALIVTASDAVSGAVGVSVDGGETWEEIQDGEAWGHAFGQETVLEEGMLCVKDAAGNIWTNEESIVLGALEQGGGGGGYSGGVHKPHSENDTGDTGKTTYTQAALFAEDMPQSELEISGRTITLTASCSDKQDVQALFSVEFGTWAQEAGEKGGLESLHAGQMSTQDNMLVLSAITPEEMQGPLSYTLHFDGAALRTLYLSGVKTLVLRVGDGVAVFQTAGFTAGTAYTRLKIAGTPSRHFQYAATISELPEGEERTADEINICQSYAFTLKVEMQGQEWQLVPAQDEQMYTQKVYCVPADYMNVPQEQWAELQNEK